jgi:hypothetical protein
MIFKLLVDFNEIHNDRVTSLRRYAEGSGAIRVGDRVLAHDDGQEEALGRVESIEGELVRVRLTWATFGPAGHLQLTPNGAWWVKTATATAGEGGQQSAVADLRPSKPELIRDRDAHTVELV